MAKPFIPTDLASLKPIVEAMIFASEEPLGPRTLLRLLFEEEKKGNGQNLNGEATLFDVEAEVSGAPPEVPVEVSAEAETLPAAAPDAESESAPDAPDADVQGTPGTDVSASGAAADSGAAGPDNSSKDSGAETEEGDTPVEGVELSEQSSEQNAEELGEPEELEGKNGAAAETSLLPPNGTNASSPQIGQKELRTIIDELNDDYEETGRPFRIVEIAGGFQFATTREYGEFVGLLSRDRMRRKLSPAALETLAIVAYRQPVTKPEVEAIRGVNCDQVLLSLLERNLIAISGRAESVGKPLLYSTTDEFLRGFGLNSLNDLPKLRELEELMEEDAHFAIKPDIIPESVADQLLELTHDNGEQHGAKADDAAGAADSEHSESGESGPQQADAPAGAAETTVQENETAAEVVDSERGEEGNQGEGETAGGTVLSGEAGEPDSESEKFEGQPEGAEESGENAGEVKEVPETLSQGEPDETAGEEVEEVGEEIADADTPEAARTVEEAREEERVSVGGESEPDGADSSEGGAGDTRVGA